MSQKNAIRTTGTRWDFLEPAMNPNHARTKHVKLVAAGAGLFAFYPKGQVVRQKDDGTNNWAKMGTAGFTGPSHIIKHPVLVNDAGEYQMSSNSSPLAGEQFNAGSVDAYYQGYFKCEEIVSAGGTNEVQTETVTATGGTRTLTVFGSTTAPLAYNANAAAIKAAILAVVPALQSADLAITGTYVYTFSGAYAGANVPAITVDATLLTGGTSTIAQTTSGAGLLTGVGRIVQGTAAVGIFELGAATPV